MVTFDKKSDQLYMCPSRHSVPVAEHNSIPVTDATATSLTEGSHWYALGEETIVSTDAGSITGLQNYNLLRRHNV